MKDSYYGKQVVILEHWNLESKAIDLKFAQTFRHSTLLFPSFHYYSLPQTFPQPAHEVFALKFAQTFHYSPVEIAPVSHFTGQALFHHYSLPQSFPQTAHEVFANKFAQTFHSSSSI